MEVMGTGAVAANKAKTVMRRDRRAMSRAIWLFVCFDDGGLVSLVEVEV